MIRDLLKKSIVFSAVLFQLNFAYAVVAKEDYCVTMYSEEIHKSLYIPGTETVKALDDIAGCFRSHGSFIDLGPLMLPWMVMAAPFRMVLGVAETVDSPIGAAKTLFRKSLYGSSLEFLTYLEEAEKSPELAIKHLMELSEVKTYIQNSPHLDGENAVMNLIQLKREFREKLNCFKSNSEVKLIKLSEVLN